MKERTIKIIKKKDLNMRNDTPSLDQVSNPRKEKREMISIVSDWVSEFRLLRIKERQQAIEQLMAQNFQLAQSC